MQHLYIANPENLVSNGRRANDIHVHPVPTLRMGWPVQSRTGVYRDNFLFFYHCAANLITSSRVTDYKVHRIACNVLRTPKMYNRLP